MPSTVPLTVLSTSVVCAPMSRAVTSPEIVFATATFGVPLTLTSPLTVSARTSPLTFVTLMSPEIDFTATVAPTGTEIT